ncbi:chitinase, partial [Enterococcus faecalis]
LPANRDAAGGGYDVEATPVAKTFVQLAKDGNSIRGLMTWSANWVVGQDVNGKSYNNEYATRYTNLEK